MEKTRKVANPAPEEKLQKRRTKLVSEAKTIERESRQLSEKPVANSEAMFKSEYDRMLRYNSRIIRRLNQQMEQSLSSRDIYALSTIMSQQREVINDLRSIADMSQQVGMIYDQAVNPFVSDLTQLVTDIYYHLRKLMVETSKPKETQFALDKLDELIKQWGLGLHTSHGVLRQSVESILIGGNTVKQPNKKRRSTV